MIRIFWYEFGIYTQSIKQNVLSRCIMMLRFFAILSANARSLYGSIQMV